MMKSTGPNRQPVIVAGVAASFLMLVFGVGYRVLAARLMAPVGTSSLSPAALELLPLQIGGWTGQEAPLDGAVVAATDTDAHISRRYSRHNALECLWLYVAYGIRARDLMPHRPEVCYTGAGWTLVDRDSAELPVDDSLRLPCNIFQFSRGAWNAEKVIVLDYYIVDGQYCGDVSLLRSKAWRGSGTIRYVVQVQIIAPISASQNADAAKQSVSTFAIESAPLITQLFENSENQQSLETSDSYVNYALDEADSG